MTQRRAIFLDRDGVINANRPDHVKTWDEFVFLPGALAALRRIAASDFLVFVMTNQAAIARGMTSDASVRDIHARMKAEVARAGGRIDAVYYCPHLPEDNCECRKPRPGLYVQGAREWNVDVARSYVVGDALADIAAARAISAPAILVLTGRGREQQAVLIENNHSGYHIADDLAGAVDWIWQREKLA
ncbi:MAG: D-glycero-beta-D-manno-heptose 1,7-bisphosphate 7-phosphatase [Chloroflexota bacterium]|nr:D-glycero-beta-D-manno-heptose 1,7-bisphosphate 7-phosphatase [Chloroflexota bacterium]